MRLIAAKPDHADRTYDDVDGFNAASVAVRARMRWAETLDDLARATAALGAAAAATPDDPRTHEWLNGRAADFESHTAGLRHWLAERGSDTRVKGPLEIGLDHASLRQQAGRSRRGDVTAGERR